MRAKLDELELEAIDHRRLESQPDPALGPLEKGVKALYGKEYAQAEKLLRQAESEAMGRDVANLARRYLAAVHSRMEDSGKEAADPYLEAIYQRNRGDLDAALEICSRGGRQSKDERFAHLAAAIHALKGENEKAAKFLEVAIQLNSRNRVRAFHDADFDALREDPEYAGLFASAE